MKYKFLFIGRDLLLPSVPRKLILELGHEVVFFNAPKDDKGKDHEVGETFENMELPIVSDPKEAQKYLNDKSYIKVVEDTLLTKWVEPLIKKGHPVLSGYKEIEEWETDRDKGMEICKAIEEYNDSHNQGSYNIRVLPQEEFHDFDSAIKFIEQNQGKWVIKEAGDSDIRALTYKGELESGVDVIARLEFLKEKGFGGGKAHFFLQKRVDGVEIACSAFFNGKDFLNYTEIDFEHQPLLAGDRSVNTGEMMNEAWGMEKEKNQLFKIIYPPLTQYLRKIGYKGFLNLNGIIDEKGYHPFEWTIRMAGCPWITQVYEMLYGKYDYGEFLADLAYGRNNKIEWWDGYVIGVRIDVPPSVFKGASYDFVKKNLEENKKLSGELQSLLKKGPEDFVEKLRDFDRFKESSYEMPVIIENFHPEKARHFHWSDAKNLKVEYREEIPYGIIEPTGCTLCYVVASGHRPKSVNKRLDNIISNMAGLPFISRDDYGEEVEEKLEKLEGWGWKLYPETPFV